MERYGLSHLQYQHDKLKAFLTKHPNMKLWISVFVIFEEQIELEDNNYETKEHIVEIRSRRYEIYNSIDSIAYHYIDKMKLHL